MTVAARTAGAIPIGRIIVFSRDVPSLAKWYARVFGMKVLEASPDGSWADLGSGGCRLGLHGGGCRRTRDCGHKFVFTVKDVARTRAAVVRRGASFGPVRTFGPLHLCDGRDPEGNILQLSNRP